MLPKVPMMNNHWGISLFFNNWEFEGERRREAIEIGEQLREKGKEIEGEWERNWSFVLEGFILINRADWAELDKSSNLHWSGPSQNESDWALARAKSKRAFFELFPSELERVASCEFFWPALDLRRTNIVLSINCCGQKVTFSRISKRDLRDWQRLFSTRNYFSTGRSILNPIIN